MTDAISQALHHAVAILTSRAEDGDIPPESQLRAVAALEAFQWLRSRCVWQETEARRWYQPDGSSVLLNSAEEVTRRRIEAAKRLGCLSQAEVFDSGDVAIVPIGEPKPEGVPLAIVLRFRSTEDFAAAREALAAGLSGVLCRDG
jgi:hypothetical protein